MKAHEDFTTVIHPDGRQLQVAIPGCAGEVVRGGDQLTWVPTEANVGLHPDGIYEAEHPNDCWVAVRDLTIVGMQDFIEPPKPAVLCDNSWRHEPDCQCVADDAWNEARSDQEAELERKWGLPDRREDCWLPEQWARRKVQEEAWAAEGVVDLSRYRCRPLPTQLSLNLGRLMAAPIMRNLDYAGVARRALVVEPI